VPVVGTASGTGGGLGELSGELLHRVPVEPDGREDSVAQPEQELAEHKVFRPAADSSWQVERVGERAYRVTGRGIERLVARYDLGNEEALAYLERRLRGIGVIAALEAEGFEPGDEVEIAGVPFELDPNV